MATLAKHLVQKSASKGLRTYNAWANAFGHPTCNMAQYLARQDVQAAYPLANVAVEVVQEDVVLNTPEVASLIATIQRAEVLLAELRSTEVVAPVVAKPTRSTPRKTSRTVAAPVVSAKPSLFKPWAIEAFNIGAKGSTFTYTSKRAQEAHTFQVLKATAEGATCVRIA